MLSFTQLLQSVNCKINKATPPMASHHLCANFILLPSHNEIKPLAVKVSSVVSSAKH